MHRTFYIFFTFLIVSLSFYGQAQAAKSAEKPRLYADMAKGEDGKYRITRITTEESRIDFVSLKPMGFDQRRWDCSMMLFGRFAFSDHRDCVPEGSEFRTSVTRPLPTALLGATTLGASMIFGIVIEESVFDEAAFDKAVAEAMSNSGLEDKREELIKRFLALTDIVEERDEELSELFRKYRDEYYNSAAPARVEKKIEDASGLYTDDLYADMIIRVNRNALTEYKPPVSNGSLSISGTPEEFEAALAARETRMHGQRLDLETSLRNATKDFPVICGPEHLEPYNLKYDCPQRITGQGMVPVAKAIVVSKNINNALPEVFTAEDSALKAVFKKGKLYIENRTGEKLQVTGASLNYRNSTAKSTKAAELPPNSSMDATFLYGLLTPEIEKAASFSNMTLREAEKTPVGMALSITYEQGNERKMLVSERVFKLADLISVVNPLKNRPAALH